MAERTSVPRYAIYSPTGAPIVTNLTETMYRQIHAFMTSRGIEVICRRIDEPAEENAPDGSWSPYSQGEV